MTPTNLPDQSRLSRRALFKGAGATAALFALPHARLLAAENAIQAVEFFQGTATKLGTAVVLNTKTLAAVPPPLNPLPLSTGRAVVSLFIKQGLIMAANYPGYQTLLGTGSLLGNESFAVRMLPPNARLSTTPTPILQVFATANSENPNAAFFNYLIPDMLSSVDGDWHQVNVTIGQTQASTPRWLIEAVDIDVDDYVINVPPTGFWADRDNNPLSDQIPSVAFNWPMVNTGIKTASGAPDVYSLYFGQPTRSPASGFAPIVSTASQYLRGLQASLAKVFLNFSPTPGITPATLIDKQAFVRPTVPSANAILAQVISSVLSQVRLAENLAEQNEAAAVQNQAALLQQIKTVIAGVQTSVAAAQNAAVRAGASVQTQLSLQAASLEINGAALAASENAAASIIYGQIADAAPNVAEAASYVQQQVQGTITSVAVAMPQYGANVIASGILNTPQVLLNGTATGNVTITSGGTVYSAVNDFGNNQGTVSGNVVETDTSGVTIENITVSPSDTVDTAASTPLGFTIVSPAADSPDAP
jgi:hypothetical protein